MLSTVGFTGTRSHACPPAVQKQRWPLFPGAALSKEMGHNGARHRCMHLTRSHPTNPFYWLVHCLWGLLTDPQKASSHHCQGHECVLSSSGNDLGLWVARFLGQEQAKISINTRAEPFMGFTRNFIGIWSCWHCVCLQM